MNKDLINELIDILNNNKFSVDTINWCKKVCRLIGIDEDELEELSRLLWSKVEGRYNLTEKQVRQIAITCNGGHLDINDISFVDDISFVELKIKDNMYIRKFNLDPEYDIWCEYNEYISELYKGFYEKEKVDDFELALREALYEFSIIHQDMPIDSFKNGDIAIMKKDDIRTSLQKDHYFTFKIMCNLDDDENIYFLDISYLPIERKCDVLGYNNRKPNKLSEIVKEEVKLKSRTIVKLDK